MLPKNSQMLSLTTGRPSSSFISSSKLPIPCSRLIMPSEPFISLCFTLRLKASFLLPLWSPYGLHSLSKATCSVLPTCLRTLIEYPPVTWCSHNTSDLTENTKGVKNIIECPEKILLGSPEAAFTYLPTRSSTIHWTAHHTALPRSLPRNKREDLHHPLITKPEISLLH